MKIAKKLTALALVLVMLATIPAAAPEASASEARDLPINTQSVGRLPHNDSVNWYRLTIPTQGRVYFTFQNPLWEAGWHGAWSWNVTLFDADNRNLLSFSPNTDRTITDSGSIHLRAGTYDIRINAGRHTDCEYTFTVNHTPYAGQIQSLPNDTRARANNITVGHSVLGRLLRHDESSWFRFTLPASRHVTLTFTNPIFESYWHGAWSWNVTLFDADNRTLTSFSPNTSRTITDSASIYLRAGTYYIRVSAGRHTSTEYRLTVRAVAPIHRTVTFRNAVNNAVITTRTVIQGLRVGQPGAPSHAGHTFEGWFPERTAGTRQFDFNSAINANTTVWARFNPIWRTISATAWTGGTVRGGGRVIDGTNVTLRATPNRGYRFDGWWENNRRVSRNANFTFRATANRTLRAQFARTPVRPARFAAAQSTSWFGTRPRTARISWTGQSGARIEIQRRQGNGRWRRATRTTAGASSWTSGNLRRGVRHSFRARAFRSINGNTVRSNWSRVRNVRIR